MVDDILLNETQKVIAAKEVPEFLESDYDDNELYQVEKMSLEGTKEKIEWCKRTFKYEQKITYRIKNQNDMTRIH